MTEVEVTIINQLGLHMRAAGKFAKTAGGFRSRISVVRNGAAIDGKSIVGILTLAAACGSTLILQAEGEDETAAIEALSSLVASRFGEEQ